MSEETKLAKLEVRLYEVQNWLSHSSSYSTEQKGTNYKNFTFRYGDNAWHPAFLDNYNSNPYSVMTRKVAGFSIVTSKVTLITDVVEIVKTYTKAKTTRPTSSFFGIEMIERNGDLSRNCMVFWMLFMAALDDEIYNNELDSIIDIAYCMDFDEAMIRDWCRAVEYVMQGNHLQEGCDFPCETLEGARFFLHKDSSNSVLKLLQ